MLEVSAVLAQVRSMASFCAGYLDHENRHVHPAMEARLPGSAKLATVRRGAPPHAFEALLDGLKPLLIMMTGMAPSKQARIASNRGSWVACIGQ